MDVDTEWDSEQEPKSDDSPTSNQKLRKKGLLIHDTLDSSIWSRDTTFSQKEDLPAQNAKLVIKAKGLMNFVGSYLEEMEIECSSTGTGFLALITETQATRDKSKTSWATRTANGNNISRNNPIWAPPRSSPLQGQGLEDRRIMIRHGKDHEARKTDSFLLG
ncbi:hypothetical protein EPUL_001908 [Erysiphe pulchra]|uniref:Uncharacterized protein n=1 Tax=Erysiphe pulchra TaxID=225359 RepID=A0A2S4PYA6_9PEZI|nr:hypothetical protein EPUL_001908 [Erysiphe pulchra]